VALNAQIHLFAKEGIGQGNPVPLVTQSNSSGNLLGVIDLVAEPTLEIAITGKGLPLGQICQQACGGQ